MQKKLTSLILSFVLLFSLAGCSSNKETVKDDEKNPPVTTETNKEESNVQAENEPSKEVSKNVKLFFFDLNKMETVTLDETVTVKDGALVTALTKALQENKSNNDFVVLTDKVSVTSAKIEDGILKVYFNDDFTKYMNLGTSSEGALVDSLVNTYGYNYNVDKVALYCKGELYTGLRGELPEGYYKTSY